MTNNKLKGKVAVVTGAGGTLCSEMARSLAAQGIKVALLGRTLEKLKVVEREIHEAGGRAISISLDVSDENAIIKAEAEIRGQLGATYILINGAGGNQADAITTLNEFDQKELENDPQVRGFFNLDMKAFSRVIEINSMGSVIPAQVFGKTMAVNGGGIIINIASMNSFRPLSRVGAYGMAKAGIANFTQWLAAYLAPANIRVNAIAPGFFLNGRSTKLLTTEDGFTSRGQNIIDHTPMKKFGTPDQLIGCMNWMIDDETSGFLTGVTVPVDGGFLASSGV